MKENNMNRRQAVAAAAAGAFAACSAPRGTFAWSDPVRFGMIGTGARGSFLLERLNSVGNAKCVALCDPYEPNLQAAVKKTNGKPKLYRDPRALLEDKEVEAVLVATPPALHYPMSKLGLDAGKHVFCEKTLVFRPQEVAAVRQAVEAHPRQVFQVGLQRRYSPFYHVARQMVEKGLLGDVMHVRAQWHRNGSGRRPVKDPALERTINWRFYRETSGGLTAELASHQFDIADWMFGATPEFVTGVGGIDYWKDGRDTYDNIHLIFRYPKGQKLVYTSISYNSHLDLLYGKRPEFGEEICGTQGTIHITIGDHANPDIGPAMALWFREPNPAKVDDKKKQENWVAGATAQTGKRISSGFPLLLPADSIQADDSFVSKELKFAKQWLYKHDIVVPEEPRNPVELMLDDFFVCVRTGGTPKAGLDVGVNDSVSVILANRAMDTGERVYYGENPPQITST